MSQGAFYFNVYRVWVSFLVWWQSIKDVDVKRAQQRKDRKCRTPKYTPPQRAYNFSRRISFHRRG